METETNVGGARRADRPELAPHDPWNPRANPNAACTGELRRVGVRHVEACPQHHPWIYSKARAKHRGARQAVAS